MSAFVFNPERIVTWPVTINQPSNGGKTQAYDIEMQFKLLDQSQITNPKDEYLEQAIKGWSGIEDAKGKPLKFNKANLKALLKIGYISRAASVALISASLGAATKNS